jgi:hypothetical protein
LTQIDAGLFSGVSGQVRENLKRGLAQHCFTPQEVESAEISGKKG